MNGTSAVEVHCRVARHLGLNLLVMIGILSFVTPAWSDVITRVGADLPESALYDPSHPGGTCKALFPPGQALICSDPYLSRLDATLAAQLARAFENGSPSRKRDVEQDQRAWVKSATRVCLDDRFRMENRPVQDCFKFAYYERINALRSKNVTGRELREACEYTLKKGSAIRGLFVNGVGRDANNDGKIDWIDVADVPTGMNFRTVARLVPNTNQRQPIDAEGEYYKKEKTLSELAWVEIKGRIFLLRALDEKFKHVTGLSYIDPENQEHLACEFQPRWREHLEPVSPRDTEVCAAVVAKKVRYLPLTPLPKGEPGDLGIVGSLMVDYDNSGKTAQLWLEHSRPRRSPYDEGADSQNFLPSPDPDEQPTGLLSDIQNWGFLWNKVQWFVFGDRTYLDDVEWEPYPDRHIRTIDAGKVRVACRARYDRSVRIEYPVRY